MLSINRWAERHRWAKPVMLGRRGPDMNRKRAWQLVFAIYLLIAVAVAIAYWLAEPIRSQLQWHERIRSDLKTLAQQRPTDANQGQWEFAVGWTHQLDCNCGETDRAWRDGFADDLERRMEGPVGLMDIEWIWDEYAKHSQYGQSYSEKYRPTRNPDFAGIRTP